MTITSRRESVVFRHAFRIQGIDRTLPAGAYDVITDEEAIEGISFLALRRITTSFIASGGPTARLSTEAFDINPDDLKEALRVDASD